MPMPAANAFPCSGCSALAAELSRERGELNREIARIKKDLRFLRRAVSDTTGLPPTATVERLMRELAEIVAKADGS